MKGEGRVAPPRSLQFSGGTSTAKERKNDDVDLETEHQSSEVSVLRTL